MKLLFLDTETTGLPITPSFGKYYDYRETKYYNSSRLLQLAYIIVECDETLTKHTIVLERNLFTAHSATENCFGNVVPEYITKNKLKEIASIFEKDLGNGINCILGHNIDFDINILMSEFFRVNNQNLIKFLNETQRRDTMKISKNVCKILNKNRTNYKFPKLAELYRFCFKININNAHDALDDTLNCSKCFFYLVENKLI